MVLALASCSSPKEEKATRSAASPEYSKEIIDAVQAPLEKAKGMEKNLQDQADQQKQLIEQAAGQ